MGEGPLACKANPMTLKEMKQTNSETQVLASSFLSFYANQLAFDDFTFNKKKTYIGNSDVPHYSQTKEFRKSWNYNAGLIQLTAVHCLHVSTTISENKGDKIKLRILICPTKVIKILYKRHPARR